MTQPTPTPDQRRYPRAHVDFDADVWVNRGGEAILIFGRLVVLGAGGAFLELGESYAIGSLLRLRFSTAELGEIACQVIVRHSLEGKGVGTEFLDMDPPDQERIKAFVDKTRGSATLD